LAGLQKLTRPDLPSLTADQRHVINHSVLRNPRPEPPGRSGNPQEGEAPR